MRSIKPRFYFWISFSIAALALAGLVSQAQSTLPASNSDQSTQVALGQSIVPLKGPWKFHIGDSPNDPATHTPVWAQPSFDDSAWESLSLTPPPGYVNPFGIEPDWTPGWQAHGHRGYWGYAWYRIKIRVQAGSVERLAVEGPAHFDDAYQIYDNGVLVGSFGKLPRDSERLVAYGEQSKMFLLPTSTSNKQADNNTITHDLALRFWMAPAALGAIGGGLHTPPLLGDADTVEAHFSGNRAKQVILFSFNAFGSIVTLLLAITAWSIAFFDRKDPVYKWIGGVFFLLSMAGIEYQLSCWTQIVTIYMSTIIISVFFWPMWLGGWMMVWWVWFGLRRPGWIPNVIGGLTLLYMLSNAVAWHVTQISILSGPTVNSLFYGATVAVRLLSLLLLMWILFLGIRARGWEGMLALPAILLVVFSTFQDEAGRLHIATESNVLGVRILPVDVANLVCAAMIFILLIRRLILSTRRQRAMVLDVQQAQAVQHVLVPENITIPGLAIQTEYRPAREVGGDFFQIIPHPTDGSVFLVAGDVTGKGLQAGMLVAVLVGAIRTAVESSIDPKAVLETLNRRLLGREGAFATCLALRIETSGQVTLANAGHLAPYLNGIEVEMEGALPLGMMLDADFPATAFYFGDGDTLTLISDGILEAQDKTGQLFGFDRIRELLQTKVTAATLAAAAQAFGQNDDISVVSIVRT